MTEAVLVGSTGCSGTAILSNLIENPSISTVHAFARRDLAITNSKLKPIIDSGSSNWAASFPQLTTPARSIFLSAIGLPRAKAGGLANQRLIEYDLNLAIAKQARAAGVPTYVLISAAGANASSFFPYLKLKGDIEKAVIELGFDSCVIVRPGLIVGERKPEHQNFGEGFLHKISNAMGSVSQGLKDMWAQDATLIAAAAVNAGLKATDGQGEGKPVSNGTAEGKTKVWYLEQKDIVRLGREK